MTRSLSSLTPPGKARILKQIEEMAFSIQALPAITPCALCNWFNSGACGKWKQKVPSEARSEGCAEWMERVPF